MADEQDEDAMFERLAASLRAVRQDAELVRTSGVEGLSGGLARVDADLRGLAAGLEDLRQRMAQQDALTVRLEAAAANSQAELRDLHEAVALLWRRLREQVEPAASPPGLTPPRWAAFPPRRAALRIGIALGVLVLAFITAGAWVASGREPALGTLAHEIVVRLSELIGIDLAGPAGPAQSGPKEAQVTPLPDPGPQTATAPAPLVPRAAGQAALLTPATVAGPAETRTVVPPSPSVILSPAAGTQAGTPTPLGQTSAAAASYPVDRAATGSGPAEPAAAASGLAELATTASGLAKTAANSPHPPEGGEAAALRPVQAVSATSPLSSQKVYPASPAPSQTVSAIVPPVPQAPSTPSAPVQTNSAESAPGANTPAVVAQSPVQAAFSALPPLQAAAVDSPAAQRSVAAAQSQAPSDAAEPSTPPPQKLVAASSRVLPAAAAPPSPATPAAPPIAASGGQPPSSQSPGQLLMRATADSWVQVRRKSGAILLRRILKPGETWQVPTEPGLILDVGNVGGVDLVVDGVPTRFTGASGGVIRNIPLDANLLASGAVVRAGH